jgi:hypothetical protein
MNPNYALKVRKDLDKLLDIGFIHLIETTQWLSPLVIVPKKKWQIAYMCGLLKIKCPNQERSIFITFLGFSGWT